MKSRAGWLLVAVLVGLPTVGLGFTDADLFALTVLEGRVRGADWSAVYDEADAAGRLGQVQGDHFPWWTARAPQARWARPISAVGCRSFCSSAADQAARASPSSPVRNAA